MVRRAAPILERAAAVGAPGILENYRSNFLRSETLRTGRAAGFLAQTPHHEKGAKPTPQHSHFGHDATGSGHFSTSTTALPQCNFRTRRGCLAYPKHPWLAVPRSVRVATPSCLSMMPINRVHLIREHYAVFSKEPFREGTK
jgi:hypothetical protein